MIITIFLYMTLVMFTLNVFMNLLQISANIANGQKSKPAVIALIAALVLITINIYCLFTI